MAGFVRMDPSTANGAGSSASASEALLSPTEANGQEELSAQSWFVSRRRSRCNTVEEKRKMRKERNKRKKRSMKGFTKKLLREDIKRLREELTAESKLRQKAGLNVIAQRNRARTFWERWRWELEKRREAMISLCQQRVRTSPTVGKSVHVQEIDPSMLHDPVIDGKSEVHYVGRGSFGIVRAQVLRGILVAVKEFLPRTVKADVIHEASLLNRICHPYLPFLIGICTKQLPFRLVLQFHAFKELESVTLEHVLQDNHLSCHIWIHLCAQLLEAIKYLHEEVNILHNDIKPNNVIVTQSNEDQCQYQVVLIDFGKATSMQESKRYHLSGVEKIEYRRNFPHIAPEVVEGETKQTKSSDIYAFGKLLFRVSNQGVIDADPHKRKILLNFAERCVSPRYYCRPHAQEGMDIFKELLESLF